MCLSSLQLNYSKGEGKCARVGWVGVKSAYPDLMALSEGIQFLPSILSLLGVCFSGTHLHSLGRCGIIKECSVLPKNTAQ